MSDDEKKYVNGEYVGRELKKEGTTNNKDWKVYDLKFKVGEYVNTYGCFKSAKGFDDLDEGKTFGLGYTEKAWTQGEKSGTNRTIFEIGEPKEIVVDTAEEVEVEEASGKTVKKSVPQSKEDYWKSKEEDILIGQSINLAVLHLGFMKQELTTSNIGKTAESYKRVIEEVRAKLKGIPPVKPKDDKDLTEITEVKKVMTEYGGTATIDQLTAKFGEGTVKMMLDLTDDFEIDGGAVKLK